MIGSSNVFQFQTISLDKSIYLCSSFSLPRPLKSSKIVTKYMESFHFSNSSKPIFKHTREYYCITAALSVLSVSYIVLSTWCIAQLRCLNISQSKLYYTFILLLEYVHYTHAHVYRCTINVQEKFMPKWIGSAKNCMIGSISIDNLLAINWSFQSEKSFIAPISLLVPMARECVHFVFEIPLSRKEPTGTFDSKP